MSKEIRNAIIDVTYISSYEGKGCYITTKLKPTSRWKIVIIEQDEYQDTILYIEHQGWVLKKWIPEGDIFFERRNEIIFDCK